MLDYDLAELYGVPTMRLNEQVRRNEKRFPADFMFVLTNQEVRNLISQFAISSSVHGGRRTLPLAFTEQGIAMLSSVLRSDQAIEVNIAIMRAFVRLRSILASNKELEERVTELELSTSSQFKVVFEAMDEILWVQTTPRKRVIGLGEED